MTDVAAELDRVAADTGFSGVVRIDQDGETIVAAAYGHADRARRVANTLDTQFAIASGSKGFTAVTVMGLVVDGVLRRDTTARSLLGDDLPLIDDRVTVEELLAHRSGIGDYLSEDDDQPITDYVLPVPVHELATTEGFLPALDGHPTAFEPDERFSYCNGGYVVLALLAERASGVPFHDLVTQRVCVAAGMAATAFLRSDELPGEAAVGYLHAGDSLRTNVLHLPVRGNGDGGIYSTVADVHRFWEALFAGRLLPQEAVAEMVHPRSDPPQHAARYGLGFWLHATGPAVFLDGYDAGVSFRSTHDPVARRTTTVIANWSEGAWPLVRALTL